jgi:hypothetical protein
MTRILAKFHRPARTLMLPLIAAALAGCQDVDWRFERNWWRRPSQPIQPAKDPPPPTTRPHLTEPSYGPAESTQTQYGLYQIHLFNGPKELTSAGGIKRFRLAHAPAGPAGRVLSILYPTIGAGGAADQPYLVYEDRTTWSAAAECVPLLDTASIDQEPPELPTSPRAVFARALGMYYVCWRPAGRADEEGLKRVVELLENVVRAPDVDGRTGWAAGVLACHIHSRVFFDFEAARHAARLSEGRAADGSFEQLVSIYRQADVLRQQGRPDQARPLLGRIVEKFQAYQNTLLYRRCTQVR